MSNGTSLLVLFGLGAAHGVNPAMGWLFAVGLGLQEQNRRAVWRALGPIGVGHALAVGAVVGIAAAVGLVVPVAALRWLVAAALLGLGVSQLFRHRHPRRGGMRVGRRELVTWSFLMATAHGAGLMALPFVIGAGAPAGHGGMHHAGHVLAAALPPFHATGLLATGVHTLGYLLLTGVIAVVVYEKVGLRMLRTMWINLDLVWAAALIVTAVLTPVL